MRVSGQVAQPPLLMRSWISIRRKARLRDVGKWLPPSLFISLFISLSVGLSCAIWQMGTRIVPASQGPRENKLEHDARHIL